MNNYTVSATKEFLCTLNTQGERIISVVASHVPDEKKVLWILVSALTLVGFFYAYFLNSAVEQVILRERALHEVAALGSTINELEFHYIAAEGAIGLAQAHALGFVDVAKEVYISRQPLEKDLSLQTSQSLQ